MNAPLALAAAAALHLGFQATVTLVVYPALSRVSAESWVSEHDRHTSAIAPVVAVVYGLLIVTVVWVVVWDGSVAAYVAGAGAVATFALTDLAARLHGRLNRTKDDQLVRRLLTVDRLRLVSAVVCAIAALAQVG